MGSGMDSQPQRILCHGLSKCRQTPGFCKKRAELVWIYFLDRAATRSHSIGSMMSSA